MESLKLPEKWQEEKEQTSHQRFEDEEAERFLTLKPLEDEKHANCPECGRRGYGPLDCSQCGYSSITGGKI